MAINESSLSDVELWKMRKLLKSLRDATGNGTSMISLIIPPGDQLNRYTRMLTDEYSTASNIKSRVNRLSVLSAITSAQHKLKTIDKLPPNGIGIFVGLAMDKLNNKEKKISLALEPIKPINYSLYLCDSKFHVEGFLSLFEQTSKYGFVIIDGHGALFATLSGNIKTILYNLSVDLPKKHGRGGQSSVRFARLRVEKRNWYIKKVAENINNIFEDDIDGFIFAGSADFKTELKNSDVLKASIKSKVLRLIDTNYGGSNGLNQAIELSAEVLLNNKYSKEKKILQQFFKEIADDGKYTFSLKSTIENLQNGSVDILIVDETLETEINPSEYNLNDDNTPEDKILFTDWIAENYKSFNVTLFFVSDKSSEGMQFKEGFGGVGGILKYKINNDEYGSDYEEIDDDDIF